LFWSPSWIAAILQYGEQVDLFIFYFLNAAILQYGRQDALFKYNLTFYNMATIFKI